MTELLNDPEAPSDAELISRVRGGDPVAYGVLFSRHEKAASRLSRQLVRGPDADDLVSEAFAKVLQVLQRGGGPNVAFRAYLLTAVRRLHVDRIRAGAKLQTSDDMTQFDPGVPFQDTAVAGFENGAAARAFASLPERWQMVLWHLEVEEQKPGEIAPLLGMSANSVSALAYRAREGLRQAFLTMHLSDLSDGECRWVNEHLGGYVRSGLSKRDSTKVSTHLEGCRNCTAMYLELTEVNSNIGAIIAPLLLGTAAVGYLGSTGTFTASGFGFLIGRARDVIGANSTAVTAAGTAAGVAAAATVGMLFFYNGTSPQDGVSDRAVAAVNAPDDSQDASISGVGKKAAGTPGTATAPRRPRPETRPRRPAGSPVGRSAIDGASTPRAATPQPPAENAAEPPSGVTTKPTTKPGTEAAKPPKSPKATPEAKPAAEPKAKPAVKPAAEPKPPKAATKPTAKPEAKPPKAKKPKPPKSHPPKAKPHKPPKAKKPKPAQSHHHVHKKHKKHKKHHKH